MHGPEGYQYVATMLRGGYSGGVPWCAGSSWWYKGSRREKVIRIASLSFHHYVHAKRSALSVVWRLTVGHIHGCPRYDTERSPVKFQPYFDLLSADIVPSAVINLKRSPIIVAAAVGRVQLDLQAAFHEVALLQPPTARCSGVNLSKKITVLASHQCAGRFSTGDLPGHLP